MEAETNGEDVVADVPSANTSQNPSTDGANAADHGTAPNNESDIAGDVNQLESDLTSNEYAQRIQELTQRCNAMREQREEACRDRQCAETAEDLARAQLTAELDVKRTMRAEIASSLERRMELDQQIALLLSQEASPTCNVTEHKDLVDKNETLKAEYSQLNAQHEQLSIMYDQYVEENTSLEKKLSGMPSADEAVMGTSRLQRHAIELSRRATLTLNQTPREPEGADGVSGADCEDSGDLDGDETIEIIPGSSEIITGGIPIKSGHTRINNQYGYNLYAKRAVSLLIEEDKSESDEMVIQKILKQAGAIMQPETDNLEKLYIPTMDRFSISWFSKFIQKLHNCGVASLVATSFGWMDEFQMIVGSPEEMKLWKRNQYSFLDMYHGDKLFKAISEGKNQQLQVAVNRYLRGENKGKKSLSELSTIIKIVFGFVMGTAESGKVLRLCGKQRKEGTSDLQYVLDLQTEMDSMRSKDQFVNLEDLFCTNAMGQLGEAIELHTPRLMKLWTTGLCGYAFLEKILDSVVQHGEVSSLAMGHRNMFNPEHEKPTRKKRSARKGQRQRHDSSEERSTTSDSSKYPAVIDPKEQCTSVILRLGVELCSQNNTKLPRG